MMDIKIGLAIARPIYFIRKWINESLLTLLGIKYCFHGGYA